MNNGEINIGAVRHLINSPDKWTQKAYARDKNNKSIYPTDESAVKWSINGAIIKTHPTANEYEDCMKAFDKFYKTVDYLFRERRSLVWEDSSTTTWKMIDRVLDEAEI